MEFKSYLEVNLSNIENNIKQIKSKVGSNVTVAPVIKANAYGIGACELKNILEKLDIKIVVVATIEEAIKLRKNGYKQEIITLNELLPYEVEKIVKYNIVPGVSDINVAYKLNEISKKQNVISSIHIEVDTGMGRVGKSYEEILDFATKISKLKNIKIEGIYTHFSSADENMEYTQIELLVGFKIK